MRVHKDGFIQCRTMAVKMPVTSYRRAMHCYPTKNMGIEVEVGEHFGICLEGVERFRLLGQHNDTVIIKIISNWVQPTRA